MDTVQEVPGSNHVMAARFFFLTMLQKENMLILTYFSAVLTILLGFKDPKVMKPYNSLIQQSRWDAKTEIVSTNYYSIIIIKVTPITRIFHDAFIRSNTIIHRWSTYNYRFA